MVDARLPDGSRVNAIIPPLAVRGAALTIRKFKKDPLKMEDLIKFGTLSPKSAQFLELCVKGALNIVISGGTGSGKTTTLNVLSAAIPADERIITVEDAAEVQLKQEHVITLESRARRTSRARARSRFATSSATRCACAPTASSSASVVDRRRSTCSRR